MPQFSEYPYKYGVVTHGNRHVFRGSAMPHPKWRGHFAPYFFGIPYMMVTPTLLCRMITFGVVTHMDKGAFFGVSYAPI